MSDESIHPRPDQAEEPADDMGASNVDLDESRHGLGHESPAAPEPGHEPAHDEQLPDHDDAHHGDADHDEDHPTDDPRWVLGPLAVGLVVGIVLVIILGLQAGADPFHQIG